MGSFSLKDIQAVITLDKGGMGGADKRKVIRGLACEAVVNKPGLPSKNNAVFTVWGLSRDNLAQLALRPARPMEAKRNLLELWAGEQGGQISLVFQGEITGAQADFNSAPDIPMRFSAVTGSYPQRIPGVTATVKGWAKVEDLFARFAAEAGYDFRNEGVGAAVRNAWYPGSPYQKLLKLAEDTGCELLIDDGQVVIMPAGQARSGGINEISAATGMIGYPSLDQKGISCRCLFNPLLRHGGLVRVKSAVPAAGGIWKITSLTHTLSANLPGQGSWETQIEAVDA